MPAAFVGVGTRGRESLNSRLHISFTGKRSGPRVGDDVDVSTLHLSDESLQAVVVQTLVRPDRGLLDGQVLPEFHIRQ